MPAVRAALQGNNVEAQRAALVIASEFPTALAVQFRLPPVLAEYLSGDVKSPELAALGLEAYGKMFHDDPDLRKFDLVPPPGRDLGRVVKKYVKSDSAQVRRAAAGALTSGIQGSTPSDKSIATSQYFVDVSVNALPMLPDLVTDPDGPTQRAAVDGVAGAARALTDLFRFGGTIGEEPKPKEGEARFGPLRPVIEGLRPSLPKLAGPLDSDDPEMRLAAARTVEAVAVARRTILNTQPTSPDPFPINWSGFTPILEKRIKDPSSDVRLAITTALEWLGDSIDSRPLLRQLTTDRVVFVRWASARGLGEMAPPKPTAESVAADVAALARLTADSDPDVRTAALTALARFGPAAKSATDAVLAAATRGDVEPRVAAVKALGALQTEASQTVGVLITDLQDSDLRLRRAAAAGLTRFGPDAKAALPELRKAVLSDDPDLRLAAAEAILSIERTPKLKEL
jgi:HEAT repeat protein